MIHYKWFIISYIITNLFICYIFFLYFLSHFYRKKFKRSYCNRTKTSTQRMLLYHVHWNQANVVEHRWSEKTIRFSRWGFSDHVLSPRSASLIKLIVPSLRPFSLRYFSGSLFPFLSSSSLFLQSLISTLLFLVTSPISISTAIVVHVSRLRSFRNHGHMSVETTGITIDITILIVAWHCNACEQSAQQQ